MEKLREGGFLISKIRKLSERIFAKLLRDYEVTEVTAAQGRVLFPLWQKDNISFKDLKIKTSLSKATLSTMLDILEEAGHVERIPSNEDKRTIYIKLTKKNRDLQHKFIQVSEEMTKIYYSGFSEVEIDEFEEYLRRLLDNLNEVIKSSKS